MMGQWNNLVTGASGSTGQEHTVCIGYPTEGALGYGPSETEQWRTLKFALDTYRRSVEENFRMGTQAVPERQHFEYFCQQLASYCKQFCSIGAPDPQLIVNIIREKTMRLPVKDSVKESCPSVWRAILQDLDRILQDVSWAQMSREEFWYSCSSQGDARGPRDSMVHKYWLAREHVGNILDPPPAEEQPIPGPSGAQGMADPMPDQIDVEGDGRGEKEKNPRPSTPRVPYMASPGSSTGPTFRTPPPPHTSKRRKRSGEGDEPEGEELERINTFLQFLQAPRESFMRKDALGHVPQGAQRHLIFSYKAKAKQMADSSMTSLPNDGVVVVKCLMCDLHEEIDQEKWHYVREVAESRK